MGYDILVSDVPSEVTSCSQIVWCYVALDSAVMVKVLMVLCNAHKGHHDHNSYNSHKDIRF